MKATEEAIKNATSDLSFSVEFFLFALDARFHHHLNIELAYYLSYAQTTHLREAARLLKVSPMLVLDKILPTNAAFFYAPPESLWGRKGGHQRLITLSEQGRLFLEEIQAAALLRRGGDRCVELKMKAEVARKGQAKAQKEKDKTEESFAEWLKEKTDLVKKNPKIFLEAIAEAAPKHGGTIKEALEVLRNARG